MMSDDDNEGQIIFGDLGAESFLTFVLPVRKNHEKYLTQETCPDRGSNLGPLRDRRAWYRQFHRGGRWGSSSRLGHCIWVSWWTKLSLGRFPRGFSRFSLSRNSFHHFFSFIHFVSFYFIDPYDGASEVVGRHHCNSQTLNIVASVHLIPRHDLILLDSKSLPERLPLRYNEALRSIPGYTLEIFLEV